MALQASRLKVGDTHEEQVVENLSRTQIVQYAGASGDYNPLHTDEVYATQAAGYPSVFAHGMLTMGLTGKMLTNYVGDARLLKFGVRFTNQVCPGDTLVAKAPGQAIREEDGPHLADLTVGYANPDFISGDVYNNIVTSFQFIPVAVIYIVAQVFLALHIYHGAWSLFQSLGLANPRFNEWRRWFAVAFALIILIGNTSMVLAVQVGYLTL